MNTGFDFEKMGKRMPYSVPEDFFAELQESIAADAKREIATARRKLRLRWLSAGMAAVAAVFAVVVATHVDFGQKERLNVEFSAVEDAFCELSADDQAYLLDVYQTDVFMNE